jgi:Flp pilus assembly protein TadG
MAKKISRFSSPRKERGQSLVEVAVSLPVILFLLVGTLDFGMAIFSYMILRDAAQEGALYGSFNPTNEMEIEKRARGIAPHEDGSPFYTPVDLSDENRVRVTIKTSAGKCQGIYSGKSNNLQVSVTYQYQLMTPFMTQLLGSDAIPITASATDVILQPPCR